MHLFNEVYKLVANSAICSKSQRQVNFFLYSSLNITSQLFAPAK